jgi:hypothetical protein
MRFEASVGTGETKQSDKNPRVAHVPRVVRVLAVYRGGMYANVCESTVHKDTLPEFPEIKTKE